MLLKRTLTALILIPLVLLGIFYLSPLPFTLVTAAIFLLAAWEMAGLTGMTTRKQRLFYLAYTLAAFIVLLFIPAIIIIAAAIITWGIMLYYVTHYESFTKFWANSPRIRAILGIWLLGTCWFSLIFIHVQPRGAFYVLFLLLFIWGADTGAYFVGRLWGKHKLAPSISPGKSVEGVIGGVVVSVLLAIIICANADVRWADWVSLIVLAALTSLVSVLGDLTESMMKRQSGMKDSGQLLPGHGGLLDRIDSLVAAAPILAAGLIVWSYLGTM